MNIFTKAQTELFIRQLLPYINAVALQNTYLCSIKFNH